MRSLRFPLIGLGLLAMLLAGWAGLARMGWRLPQPQPAAPASHGALMVCGFLGTVIAMERAVALSALATTSAGKRLPYLAPALATLGSLALILGLPHPVAAALLTAAALALAILLGIVVHRQPATFTAVMALGAILWLGGNLFWLAGAPLFDVVWWWAGFLVLTIAGERLEMSRMLRRSRLAGSLFLLAAGVTVIGIVLVAPVGLADVGVRVAGAGMVGIGLWLLRYDMARRTIRATGLTRFIAANLLPGYVWLTIAGVTALLVGRVSGGPLYDATLHAIFLGFVFGLIFGHAPVIFPAVLGVVMTYTPAYYTHVVLLQASLLLRLAGDFAGSVPLRQWGGMLNFVALLLFLVNTIRNYDQAELPLVYADLPGIEDAPQADLHPPGLLPGEQVGCPLADELFRHGAEKEGGLGIDEFHAQVPRNDECVILGQLRYEAVEVLPRAARLRGFGPLEGGDPLLDEAVVLFRLKHAHRLLCSRLGLSASV